MRFLPWSLPRVGYGSGKRHFMSPGHLPNAGSTVGKRVRLTRKTRPGVISHDIPDLGHPTPRRWKRLRSTSSEGVGGEVGEPRNLFPTGTDPILISCTRALEWSDTLVQHTVRTTTTTTTHPPGASHLGRGGGA